jgi:probable F420-dependent oxidoreductase
MRFGLDVANAGAYSDPRTMIRVAQAAEEAGWELLLVWDHLAFVWGPPAADPWVTLAAVATSTERILLGPGVTPVPRRRPHVLAHQIATLDVLSGGRVVFGAGLGGGHGEFRRFGEPEEARDRAPLLDEGLTVIRALLDGGEVTHHGEHFTVERVTLAPAPGPRLPIWVGGMSRKARERAARFDGWFADTASKEAMTATPDELRTLAEGFELDDVAVLGYSEPGQSELHQAYEDAGATWWIEQVHDARADLEAMLARIEAGP